MKNLITKFMPKSKKEKLIMCSVVLVVALLCCTVIPVCADVASDMVTKLISLVCKIFLYIGILLAVWAIGMLILAFKNEDADSKSRAMMLLVVACMLIGIDVIVESLGLKELIPNL